MGVEPEQKRAEAIAVAPLTGGATPRCIFGGALMGLANLVPGISGGTMLLAAGVYPRFIRSISSLSALRFTKSAIGSLALIAGAAALAILLGAGPVRDSVVNHRWIMYSLFIGLTLGGVPLLLEMAKPAERVFWFFTIVGVVLMVALAVAQSVVSGGDATREGWMVMFVAGVAGASAMILPGVSGGYLLLLLGVYVPILTAIDVLKNALRSGDLAPAVGAITGVVIPVGIGVVIGVLVVSNLVAIVLRRYEQETLGSLMGLLIGAVAGLWPFQQGVAPKVGDMFKGRVLTPEAFAELSPAKYPTEFFMPSAKQALAAIVIIVAGYLATRAVTVFGEKLGP